jgi:DNA adenine methylase
MRYLGGKSRIAKQLAAVIDQYREPGQWVWDPFCGGLSMAAALSAKGPVLASDANPALIALYQAVRDGWQPPTEVSREQYAAARQLPDSDPLKAFCGFGCSFGGVWFAGQAAPRYNTARVPRLYSMESSSANILRRDVPKVPEFAMIDFLAVEPHDSGMVLYLDPPYRGTTGYAATGPFDHARFDARARQWAEFGPVFVSEYDFPGGIEVWSQGLPNGSSCFAKRPERLYLVQPAQ